MSGCKGFSFGFAKTLPHLTENSLVGVATCIVFEVITMSSHVHDVFYFFCFLFQSAILMKDIDMMVDASLFLWSKCKPHFQRILSSSLENCKQLLNDVFFNRVSMTFVYLLEQCIT